MLHLILMWVPSFDIQVSTCCNRNKCRMKLTRVHVQRPPWPQFLTWLDTSSWGDNWILFRINPEPPNTGRKDERATWRRLNSSDNAGFSVKSARYPQFDQESNFLPELLTFDKQWLVSSLFVLILPLLLLCLGKTTHTRRGQALELEILETWKFQRGCWGKEEDGGIWSGIPFATSDFYDSTISPLFDWCSLKTTILDWNTF